MSKSRNLVKFLGVGHPAVKVVCEAARGGECDLEGKLHPGWVDDGGQAMDGFFSNCI